MTTWATLASVRIGRPPSANGWGPFLPAPANSWTITQPQLLLDPVGGAYLLVVSATRPSDHSSLLVRAYTRATGPVDFGEWNMAEWDVSNNKTLYPDYLAVAQTSNAVLAVANMFAWADGSFQFPQLWSFPKADLYPPFPLTGHTIKGGFNHADGSPAWSVVPALSYVNSTVTYLVSSWYPGQGTANNLSVWQIDTQNPIAPIFQPVQTVPVADFSEPPKAQQQGTDVLVSTWDTSITSAVLQPNGLWVTHPTGVTPEGDDALRSGVRWCQLDPATLAVQQQGTLGFKGAHLYWPSITANARGDLTLAYSASADNAGVGLYYSGRRVSDPVNTPSGFDAKNIWQLRLGEGCFERPAGQNFLGGRTAVALDLSDGQSMWMFGAYAAGNNANCQANGWGTWFGRVTW
jgi:hypothetical protein